MVTEEGWSDGKGGRKPQHYSVHYLKKEVV